MTRNWKTIIEIAEANGGIVTRQQAIAALEGNYYCNGEKYVSDSLTKMVGQSVLAREGRGVYRLLQKPMKKTATPIIENQISMF